MLSSFRPLQDYKTQNSVRLGVGKQMKRPQFIRLTALWRKVPADLKGFIFHSPYSPRGATIAPGSRKQHEIKVYRDKGIGVSLQYRNTLHCWVVVAGTICLERWQWLFRWTTGRASHLELPVFKGFHPLSSRRTGWPIIFLEGAWR